MLLSANKRVSENAAILCQHPSTQTGYKSAAPGGPAGSALMTFGVVLTWRPNAPGIGNNYVFSRYDAGNAGWYIFQSGSSIRGAVNNGVGVAISCPFGFLVPDQPTIVLYRYDGVTIEGWLNGVSTGTAGAGAGGFNPAAVTATMIGCLLASASFNCTISRISECVMLDGYDAAPTIAALTAQWQEDLQQGRPLTWPRVMTANDWYWSARDALVGSAAKPAWIDRGPNAVSLAKAGAPQPCSVTPRFA